MRCAPMLGFPGRNPLFTGVVPALVTHAVRTLHAPAARARLNGNGGGLLVRVPRTLLPLGGASLGDSHGRSVVNEV